MARLSAALIVVVSAAFLLGVHGSARVVQDKDVERMTWNDFYEEICTNNMFGPVPFFCDPTTTTKMTTTATITTTKPTTPKTTTKDDDDDSADESDKTSRTTSSTSSTTSSTTTRSSSSSSSSTTTVSGSPLEKAHWCRFSNGSYLALNQAFIHNDCSYCQCIQSRAIRCTYFQCMTTYCIDGSTPVKRPGQCCQQCVNDTTSTACVLGGLAFPTGTLLRRTTDNIQCWCQLGTVECRKSGASVLSGLDYWGEGTAVYVIVIVICVVLVLGTLLCCGGGFLFYYYYYNNQQSFQDAYAQYYSNAGWQPMGEDGQVVVDGVAQEKQVEAEQQHYEQQHYPTGESEEYIPPPYALYNGSHVQQQTGKEQHFG